MPSVQQPSPSTPPMLPGQPGQAPSMAPEPPPTLELRDIIVPEAPWWHIPTGYWLIAAIVILSILFVVTSVTVFIIWRRRRRERIRLLSANYQAEIELQRIEYRYHQAENSPETTVSALTALLRRIAVQLYGRQACASLSGLAWVEFLQQKQSSKPPAKPSTTENDSSLSIPVEAQQLIAESQYREPQPAEIEALITYLHEWLAQFPLDNPNKPRTIRVPLNTTPVGYQA